jgi:hypothetical protein
MIIIVIKSVATRNCLYKKNNNILDFRDPKLNLRVTV